MTTEQTTGQNTEQAPNRTQRRQQERAQRKLASSLFTSVSRMELSKVMAPIVTAGQQHECILSFLLEKGFVLRDGRAMLDQQEFEQWLAEKNEQAKKTA